MKLCQLQEEPAAKMPVFVDEKIKNLTAWEQAVAAPAPAA
jgi:hypothetical protein